MTPRDRTTGRQSSLPEGTLPRGLSRIQAAEFVGVSTSTFDRMVADNLMPKPIRVYGRVLWDIRAINAAFDALDGESAGADNKWAKMAV
jgi:predicted DNA-binding transcriptional regulator AlpA